MVVGHSLGAGAAALLALMLRSSYPQVRCYAFSPPRGLLRCVPSGRRGRVPVPTPHCSPLGFHRALSSAAPVCFQRCWVCDRPQRPSQVPERSSASLDGAGLRSLCKWRCAWCSCWVHKAVIWYLYRLCSDFKKSRREHLPLYLVTEVSFPLVVRTLKIYSLSNFEARSPAGEPWPPCCVFCPCRCP